MIVCLCHVVPDSKIRELADEGVRTVKAVERACGAGSDCGTCRAQVACVLREARAEREAAAGAGTTSGAPAESTGGKLIVLRPSRAA